jgi:hypothetical protein
MEIPKSKTKIGAAIVGIGTIFGVVGNYLLGNPVGMEVLAKLLQAIGGIGIAFGVRDWPVLNRN